MDMVTLPAHFDGKQIKLDKPYKIEPDTRLLVTVLPKRLTGDDEDDWFGLSVLGLANAYDEAEIEYSLDLIKEENAEYEGG
jgi:hypothetical protein